MPVSPEIPVVLGIAVVEGQGLDGVPFDVQDEVMDGGHICPCPIQQLKVGMPDPLGRERV